MPRNIEELVQSVAARVCGEFRMAREQRVIIGISGAVAIGKSRVTEALEKALLESTEIAVLHFPSRCLTVISNRPSPLTVTG